MLRPQDKKRRFRQAQNPERIIREFNIIDTGELGQGEYIDHEQRSRINGGAVEIDEISIVRTLGCGHIVSSTAAMVTCDHCGSICCSECCNYVCAKCQFRICRHCTRIWMDGNGSRHTLCHSCYPSVLRSAALRKAANGIFGFFVERRD